MKIQTTPPGIYFGMPEDEYHADPSLSASGVKSLLVSPLTYWANTLDPEREEDDDDTAAQIKGKATHKAVLEGMDAFDDAYAIAPDPADYPDHIKGGPALKARCKELGVSAGGTIAYMSERIREQVPGELLWTGVEEEFADRLGDRTTLKPDVGAYVRRTADLVHANPAVRKAVNGGFPEVSIFWHADGIPWKCRVDYLKTRAGIDLKTFTNLYSKPLDTAVAHAVAQHRYHVQAKVYLDGLKAAEGFRLIDWIALHGAAMPDQKWQDAFRGADPRFIFLFVETGRVPNVALREFRQRNSDGQETLAYQAAEAAVEQAAASWLDHMERFGTDQPWIDESPMRAFDDAEFPLYMTE